MNLPNRLINLSCYNALSVIAGLPKLGIIA